MSNTLKRCLEFLADRVLQAGPVFIHRCLSDTWIIFTDGACSPEETSGSVGGVVVSPKGIVIEYFSEKVPDDVTARLFKESKNPIHELEVLPVLMALQLWHGKLQKSQVVFYIDNDLS